MLQTNASLLRPKSRPKAFDDLQEKAELQIMAHLPSMRDKLRMGAVSRHLNQHANEHLRTCTWHLELTFAENPFKSEYMESQFEVDVRPFIPNARRTFFNHHVLSSLARKTCFSDIIFHLRSSEHPQMMASVQQACLALSQHPDCLSKTNAFKIDYYEDKPITALLGLEGQSACVFGISKQPSRRLPEIVYQVLGLCELIRRLQFHHVSPKFPALRESLNGKSLTEIVLKDVRVPYDALRDLFLSLKPNTLQSVNLYVVMETKEEDDWSITQFFQQMSQGPWSAVESLHYNFWPLNLWPHDYNVKSDLLQLFPRLISGSCQSTYSFDQTLENQTECNARFLKSAEQNQVPVERSESFGPSGGVLQPALRPKSRPLTFNDLPEDVVHEILTHLPSMRDKLAMGAMSRRLNRRADEHLRTCTWRLELVFSKSQVKSDYTESQFEVNVRPFVLNTRRTVLNRKILVSLARRTCFSDIIFHLRDSEEMASVEQACLALSQHPDCFSKTKTFKIDYEDKDITSLTSYGASVMIDRMPGFAWAVWDQPTHPLPEIVYQVLGLCPLIRGLQFHNVSPKFPALQQSLNGKRLTEIVLEGVHVTYEALRDLFVSLQPNTLKDVSLYVIMKTKEENNWSIAQFFQQMSQGPWSAIESLHYNFCPLDVWPHEFNLMSSLLDLFPKLIDGSCQSAYSFDQTLEDRIECIDRFFMSSEKNQASVKRSVSFGHCRPWFQPACEIAVFMERIIDRHYNRKWQLTLKPFHMSHGVLVPTCYVLSISQAMATFNITNLGIRSCAGQQQQVEQNDANQGPCGICRGFYFNTSMQIIHMVTRKQGGHIDDYFLNPCCFEQLGPGLKVYFPNEQIQVNRDEGTGEYAVDVGQIHITLGSQRCIVPGCTKCMENFV